MNMAEQLSSDQLVLLEQVVRRHLHREFADRNRLTHMKPLSRLDLRDAVRALRSIRETTTKEEYNEY